MAKSSDKNKITSKATNAKAHDKTMGKPQAVKKTTAQHGSRFAKTGVSHFRLLKIFAALMVAGVLVLWLLLWPEILQHIETTRLLGLADTEFMLPLPTRMNATLNSVQSAS